MIVSIKITLSKNKKRGTVPIIKSAVKALKQSRARRERNLLKKKALKTVVKKTSDVKDMPKAQSTIDKIAKTGYIHKNKAARLKSRLAKRLKTATQKPEVAKKKTK